MLSLAGGAPLPLDPGGLAGTLLESLPPLAAWFRGAFCIVPLAAEVLFSFVSFSLSTCSQGTVVSMLSDQPAAQGIEPRSGSEKLHQILHVPVEMPSSTELQAGPGSCHRLL